MNYYKQRLSLSIWLFSSFLSLIYPLSLPISAAAIHLYYLELYSSNPLRNGLSIRLETPKLPITLETGYPELFFE